MAIIWVGTGRFSAYIGPVQDYIDRVVAADVAAGNTLGLEVGVRDAYDVFIRDSINVGDLGTSGGVLSQANSIIKAAPIMAGARTLAGALVPLVGAAPTRFGTEGGWSYNRKTGTAGNGTDNYLNSNRANNADPQNSKHLSVHVSTQTSTQNLTLIGQAIAIGSSHLTVNAAFTPVSYAARVNGPGVANIGTLATGFVGLNRSTSTGFVIRSNGATSAELASVSTTPASGNILVFGGINIYDGRLSFYSIGESINLTQLDSRLTTLMNAIAAAIP
jgi:hypothetical protein